MRITCTFIQCFSKMIASVAFQNLQKFLIPVVFYNFQLHFRIQRSFFKTFNFLQLRVAFQNLEISTYLVTHLTNLRYTKKPSTTYRVGFFLINRQSTYQISYPILLTSRNFTIHFHDSLTTIPWYRGFNNPRYQASRAWYRGYRIISFVRFCMQNKFNFFLFLFSYMYYHFLKGNTEIIILFKLYGDTVL